MLHRTRQNKPQDKRCVKFGSFVGWSPQKNRNLSRSSLKCSFFVTRNLTSGFNLFLSPWSVDTDTCRICVIVPILRVAMDFGKNFRLKITGPMAVFPSDHSLSRGDRLLMHKKIGCKNRSFGGSLFKFTIKFNCTVFYSKLTPYRRALLFVRRLDPEDVAFELWAFISLWLFKLKIDFSTPWNT